MAVTVETIALGPVMANTYILTDEVSAESAVIDAGAFNDELLALIENKNVKYILLTHGHYDHILGVPELRDVTKAKVAIHELDAQCLENEYKSLAAWQCPGEQRAISADIILSDGDIIKLGETEIRVMHTPGHTRGGVCYIIDSERIIFSGDTLFCLTAGRTDFEGSSAEQLMASLIRLRQLDGDYKVYTGHNRSTTLDFERTHNRYLRRIK